MNLCQYEIVVTYLVKVTDERGHYCRRQIEADELFLPKNVDDGLHEPVQHEHVAGQVKEAVVTECREDHRDADGPGGDG